MNWFIITESTIYNTYVDINCCLQILLQFSLIQFPITFEIRIMNIYRNEEIRVS